MEVKINLPYYLQQFVGDQEIVEVEGMTVKECLVNLTTKYPAMAPEVFDVDGDMAVIVLHGEVPISEATIDSQVRDGDTLRLFPIIIGG